MKQLELQQKLGERIDALSRADMSDEDFVKEVERSKAMASIAKEMVRNAHIILTAKKSVGELNKDLVDTLV